MYELSTEIEIDAGPGRVWEVLTDGTAYPSWNPFVRRLEGRLGPGESLVVVLRPPGGRAFLLKPRVIVWEEGQTLAWRGRLGIPGIFDGEHHFEVRSRGAGRSRFLHWERFSGLLVPLLKRMLDGSTRAGFVAMNQALKARAEATAPHSST
jgi:hypothetical protein